MTKTHLSVWVLPRSQTQDARPPARRANRTGAFIVAACGDTDFAVEPKPSCNKNRRIWPHTAPTRPRIFAR